MRIDKTKENIKDKWYLRRIMIHSGVDVVREGKSVLIYTYSVQTRRPSILELMTHVNLWLINLFIDPNRNIGIKVLAGMFLVLPIILTSLFLLSVTGFKFHVNLNYSEHLLLKAVASIKNSSENNVYSENRGRLQELVKSRQGGGHVMQNIKGVVLRAVPESYNPEVSTLESSIGKLLKDRNSILGTQDLAVSLLKSKAVRASDIMNVSTKIAEGRLRFTNQDDKIMLAFGEGQKTEVTTLQDVIASMS